MKNKGTPYIIILFIFISTITFGQGQGNIWIFGDSAGIDFNASSPTPVNSVLISNPSNYPNECSASISDSMGNLFFYTNGSIVWNSNHIIMQNGDSLTSTSSATQGALIIPFPDDSLKYYVFNIGYFSVVDMNLDEGLGDIIPGLKNIEVLNILFLSEKLNAVRHGNGNDWWILIHGLDNNTFYKFIATNAGVFLYDTQNIGSVHYLFNAPSGLAGGAMGEMAFSQDGSRLAAVNLRGVIDVFDFDRCTGQLSNWLELGVEDSSINLWNYSCEFSPNGKVLYVSILHLINEIIQFNLNNDLVDSIILSKQIIWQATAQEFLGQLQLAPDNKIYLSSADANDTAPSTVHSFYNENLTVINDPDSLGSACNLTPHSFYLGGKTVQFGLPNMPNYNLGPTTPICDTTYIVCPLANFSHTDTGLTVWFTNNSLAGADSWYFWDFGDSATDTVKNPTHTYTNPGTYTVFLVVTNTCGSDTFTQTVTVDVLGINEKWLSYKIKLYPNPNDGNMQLDYKFQEGQEGKLIIFDIMGKKLFTFPLVNEINTLKISESSLNNGLYFYKIIINNEIVSIDKLIISK